MKESDKVASAEIAVAFQNNCGLGPENLTKLQEIQNDHLKAEVVYLPHNTI